MIYDELKKRNLPPLKSREEMVEILQREEYGYLPDVEYKLEASEPLFLERRYASGSFPTAFCVNFYFFLISFGKAEYLFFITFRS